jgi:hypothetical protein
MTPQITDTTRPLPLSGKFWLELPTFNLLRA